MGSYQFALRVDNWPQISQLNHFNLLNVFLGIQLSASLVRLPLPGGRRPYISGRPALWEIPINTAYKSVSSDHSVTLTLVIANGIRDITMKILTLTGIATCLFPMGISSQRRLLFGCCITLAKRWQRLTTDDNRCVSNVNPGGQVINGLSSMSASHL